MIVTVMAGALSDYGHRRHLQDHTLDGQSRMGGSYLKIVTGGLTSKTRRESIKDGVK